MCTPFRFRRIWCHLAALAVVGVVGSVVVMTDVRAQVQPIGEAMRAEAMAMPIERLQAVTLDCCDVAERRLLSSGEAAYCSVAWETLRQRRFQGDADAMLAWWRANRVSVASSN